MATEVNNEILCVPIHLDAFVLAPGSFKGKALISPISQPYHVSLRPESDFIRPDVLDHCDLHRVSPAIYNSRVANLGTSPAELNYHRLGVNLHWSLPRCYRRAESHADGSSQSQGVRTEAADPSYPVFPLVPNRWLVVRRLIAATPPNKIPKFQSWVVESDRRWEVDDIPDDYDLETDVTPFVNFEGDPSDSEALKKQGEVFIGSKTPLESWSETSKPHVKLTVANSSNPWFADFAIHNPNVFSTMDDFAYKDGDATLHLTEAKADYFVIGWHSTAAADPMDDPGSERARRLSQLMLRLNTNTGDHLMTEWNASTSGTRCLLHGAIYGVSYSRTSPPKSLADTAAEKFTSMTGIEPLSVGTTALDGMLAFLNAHKDDKSGRVLDEGARKLAEEISIISQLVYVSEDEYNSRVKAQDLVLQHNYSRSSGGTEWHYAGQSADGCSPAVASSTPDASGVSDLDRISQLNTLQTRLDITERELASARWSLFAEWWKYMSDERKAQAAVKAKYQSKVQLAKTRVQELVNLVSQLRTSIDFLVNLVDCKKTNKPPFYSRKDIAICVAGVDSGWPLDFMDPLTCRLDHQIPTKSRKAVYEIYSEGKSPVPSEGDLQGVAEKLLAECLSSPATDNGHTTGFQSWEQNPFVPLFIEWEGDYYHVDKKKWSVELRRSPIGHSHQQVCYVVNEDLASDSANQKDVRSLSGRMTVMPHAALSLQAAVIQVLDRLPESSLLDKTQRDDIRKNIQKLKFISASLDGFTAHLLTRVKGAHVKPNVRSQGQSVEPLTASTAPEIGFDLDTLRLIDAETGVTPYGRLQSFGKDSVPFKGVTHGQMTFTKLNIVDKFGQVVCAPLPRPRRRWPREPPEPIYPCLSDYLTPDMVKQRDGLWRPNTIFLEPETDEGKTPICRFIQLTPSINQDARITASFVAPNPEVNVAAGSPAWRQIQDFEPPVWGWIIINYADCGLQFFLANGTFYREVRISSTAGAVTGSKWLPAAAPDRTGAADQIQMDELIQALASRPGYLQAFFDVINGSIRNMPFPPADYAGCVNAIVGKPLALVNVGWGLELAEPALKAQNTIGGRPKDEAAELASYAFSIKLGDLERPFDGLVGYFLNENGSSPPKTEWDKLYTYFTKDIDVGLSADHVVPITPKRFPTLNPYYIDPVATGDISAAVASRLLVTTIIADPYTPCHAYSPILPIASIQVPAWATQAVMKNMAAFFHLGPMLLSRDVSPRDPAKDINSKTWVHPPVTDTSGADSGAGADIKLPISNHKGDWNWLQPYSIGSTAAFNRLTVAPEDEKLRHDPAPYTLVEGYLELATSAFSRKAALTGG